jgi:glycosyltransferase involved in cell wall biosynthesis
MARPLENRMTYRLALLSEISLIERDGQFWTLDLWVKDLQAQRDAVKSMTLFSPVVGKAPAEWALLPVPGSIKVMGLPSATVAVTQELGTADVVQIPGNFTWWNSRRARAFARIAHRVGRPVILGISSDRATTHLVNARGKSILHRIRARLRSLSVKFSQRHLARHSDGTFVVGEGLRRLVESASSNIFVGTASWIRASDILPPRGNARRDAAVVKLCVAARLEPMKGIHLALEAIAVLKTLHDLPKVTLVIAGQGPEEPALRQQAETLQLQEVVEFAGTFAYPGPFFELLRRQDIVVLTNLNDEQPRLVFDAISQGCLIVCPDSLPYRALGIPERLLYRRGDPQALAAAAAHAIASLDDLALRSELDVLVRNATIETMHERRREWVQSTVVERHALRREQAGT